MAHELEQDQNGQTAFVSGNNVDPWHRLGTVLPESLSAEQALEHAHLGDWNVRKTPLFTNLAAEGEPTNLVEVPGMFAVARNNPFTAQPEVIGTPGAVVGRIYKPFQNEQGAEFLAAITDEYSDAEFETAGSMRGGTQVFVTMRLKNFLVGGVDAHSMYLVYIFNHGTGSNIVFTTHIRVVCANTADWALSEAKFRFRHSASIDARHEDAREALRLSFNYNAIFEKEAESMLRHQMDLDDFRSVCDEIWPQPEEDEKLKTTRWSTRREQLRQLFLFAETQEDIRFTRWGAFNAITEYEDHFSRVQGKTTENKRIARALNTIDGDSNVKHKAFDLLRTS